MAKASAVNAQHSAAIAGPSQIHDTRPRLLTAASSSARLPATARAASSTPARPMMIQIQRRHRTITAQVRAAHGGGKARTGAVPRAAADDMTAGSVLATAHSSASVAEPAVFSWAQTQRTSRGAGN